MLDELQEIGLTEKGRLLVCIHHVGELVCVCRGLRSFGHFTARVIHHQGRPALPPIPSSNLFTSLKWRVQGLINRGKGVPLTPRNTREAESIRTGRKHYLLVHHVMHVRRPYTS